MSLLKHGRDAIGRKVPMFLEELKDHTASLIHWLFVGGEGGTAWFCLVFLVRLLQTTTLLKGGDLCESFQTWHVAGSVTSSLASFS